MSGSGAFCPRCGDSIELSRDRRVERGEPALCDACYFEDFELVDAPEELQVTYCSECGAVQRGERWVDVGARDYTDVAVDAVTEALGVHVEADSVSWTVEPEQVDQSTVRLHCHFTGVVRGTPVEASATVPAKLAAGTCDRCGRIAGDFFAATVQVRAAGEREPTDDELRDARELAHEVVAEQEATGDRDAFVAGIDEVDGGLDVRVSTAGIARKVASRLVERHGGATETSERLVTEDADGERVYRTAHVVRLPPYSPGDVIQPDDGDGPVLVESAHQRARGRRLESGDRFDVELDDLPEDARIGGADDAAETTLVSVEDEHAAQVLDPETYATTTVPRPDYLDPDAETVRVLKHREGLHVLPDEREPAGEGDTDELEETTRDDGPATDEPDAATDA